jgi:hypothetical protein
MTPASVGCVAIYKMLAIGKVTPWLALQSLLELPDLFFG